MPSWRVQATDALPVLAQRQATMQAQLGQVGHQLGRFGQGLVSGTHDLFEQVCPSSPTHTHSPICMPACLVTTTM